MARRPTASAKQPPEVVKVGVPNLPALYGVKPRRQYQTWGEIEKKLIRSRNYWICTTRADRRPHSAPVWGMWLDGALYFGTGRTTVKGRNLAGNPAVSVHLESGDDVVILEGTVTEVSFDDKTLLKQLDAASRRKYKMPMTTIEGSVLFRLRPRVAFAWTEKGFPKDATRWELRQ